MKITARGLWALVNINLFLFILSFSHSLPGQKKPCLLHIPIHSSLSMGESPLSTPQRRRHVASAQSEGWMKPKPRLTSHACCIGFQFAFEQNGDNKTCTGLWFGTKKRWKKNKWNPIFQDTLHSKIEVYRMPDPRVLQRRHGNDFHFSIFTRNS